jgi:glycosyltransferase involved in cell wall biosynthesis
VVGKIARLFHLKGHEYLIQAARRILDKHPQVFFLLVGDGLLRDRLIRDIRAYNIENNFIFTGLVSPDSIPEYIYAMDIVVHLSLREGLPRVVPQSFLLKKPVIAYDCDGAIDVIDDQINGFLIEPRSISTLTEKLSYLIENKTVRTRMGAAGARKAWALFPHTVMIDQLDLLYRELVGN